jgi:hypothetical protein
MLQAIQRKQDDRSCYFANLELSGDLGGASGTHSLPWSVASVVPWLGGPFETGGQISDVVLGVVADVLQPSVHVAAAISPDRLVDSRGRVDVQLLREAAPALSEISTAATKLDSQARTISDPKYLSLMRNARSKLQAQTSDISRLLQNTAMAARLAPSMMGVGARMPAMRSVEHSWCVRTTVF